MKLLMLIVDNFEDTEAIGTLDVLKRGNIEVDLVSLMDRKNIITKTGLNLNLEKLITDVSLEDYSGVIIPGGPGSFKIMPNLDAVNEIINYYANSNKLVASICAAPHLVGKLGYFKNRNYTVHPGFEGSIIGGNYQRELGVVVDGNFITAKSMYYSLEFGFSIYEYFFGKEKTANLRKSCMGE